MSSFLENSITSSTISDNYSTISSATTQDKTILLQERKQEKIQRLNPRANLEDSYTQLEDGSLESNKNKIWNSLSDPEYQNMYSQVMRDYTLVKGDDGKTRFAATGEEYTGPTSWFYQGTAKQGDAYKLGINRGDKHYRDRYTPNGLEGKQAYGWESGPEGINPETMGGVLLPQNAAVTLEGITHGREAALANRVAMSGDLDAKARLGSGYTEYYKGPQGALGDTSQDANVSEQAMKEQWQQWLGQTQTQNPGGGIADKELYKKHLESQRQNREADRMGVGDRVVNTLAGLGKSFTQNLALDTADWVGETLKRQTGWGWDVGTEEEKADMASKVFGYNQVLAQRGQEKAKEHVTNLWNAATKEDVDFKVSDAFGLIKEVFTTPEMIGESVGYVMAMLPGVGIKAAKAATSAATTLDKAKKAYDVAKTTGDLGKVAEAKQMVDAANNIWKASEKTAAVGKALRTFGVVNVATGDVNDQIDEYTKNNNGVPPTASEIMFRMMPIAVASTALDKFSMSYTVGMTKDALGVGKEALKEVVEEVPEAVKDQLWKKVGTAALGISKAAGVEAGQEYVQTMAEVFNKQYDTEKYGDDVGKILTSEENVIEALTGAAFGAGQGAQMNAVSPLWNATKAGVAATGTAIASGMDGIKGAIDTVKEDASTLVDADGKKVTAEELDKELDDILSTENTVTATTQKPEADTDMSMEDILGSLGIDQNKAKKMFGDVDSQLDGTTARFGTSLEVMRVIEDHLEKVVKEGKVSPEYVDSLHKLLVDRSSGDQISSTMQKVLEVKEAAKKLNEAYRVIIEDASESSIQAGTGRSSKTMSEVTREVADDVQKWFNIAIKADKVINSSASAESKRTAQKHKAAVAEHLQRLTSSHVSKLNEIKNTESDAIRIVNQMVLSELGNDVSKADNPLEVKKALVKLKADLQKLFVENTKGKTVATLANQRDPVSKGYVVAKYGTKGVFVIPLHMVVEKMFAEEFADPKKGYSIDGKFTVTPNSRSNVLTGSTQYTGTMRSVETEIKALETISRYVAGAPILTKEDRDAIVTSEKQELEDLVTSTADEYADLDIDVVNNVDEQDVTFDYDEYIKYKNGELELSSEVVDRGAKEAVVEDVVTTTTTTIDDVLTEDFTVDDIPDIASDLEELVELKSSIDESVTDVVVEAEADSDIGDKVKERLVQVLSNSGASYKSRLEKAIETIGRSLSNYSLFENTVDEQVKEILSGSKDEVVALYKQYKKELEEARGKEETSKNPVTTKQAVSKNVSAVLQELQDELRSVKSELAKHAKDIREIRANKRKEGWSNLWPFSEKVAIELENDYYATKTGGVQQIKNTKLVLRDHTSISGIEDTNAKAFLESFGLTDDNIAGGKKPAELQSATQKALQKSIEEIEQYLEDSGLVARKEELESKIKSIKATRSRGLRRENYEKLELVFENTAVEAAPVKASYKDKLRQAKTILKSKKEWIDGLFKELSEVDAGSKEGFNIVYNKLHNLLTVMQDTKDEKEKSVLMALQDKLVNLKDSCR